jgi:hypothetical protein
MFRILKNVFFVLWNISIVLFSITLIIEDYLKDDLNIKTRDIIGVILFFGIIFFLFFLIFYERSVRVFKKDVWYFIIPASLLFISLFGFVIKSNTYAPKRESFLSFEKKIERLGGGEFVDTQPVINTTPPIQEADPIVNCNISQECGGGVKLMRKSECDNATCCGIGDSWYLYDSLSECKKADERYWEDYYKEQKEYWEDYYAEKYKEDDYQYDIPELPPLEPLPSLDLTIPDYSTYTPEVDIEAAIKKCEDRAREDTKSRIDGCYVQYEGSAANMCAKGYQDLGAKAISNCRNMY